MSCSSSTLLRPPRGRICFRSMLTGGVAALNHRPIAATPAGSKQKTCMAFVSITIAMLLLAMPLQAQEKLTIAFASYRDRPKYSHIFYYEHDGSGSGKLSGGVSGSRSVAAAEAHPWLSGEGRFCAFTFELENKTSVINFWDNNEKKLVTLPKINDSPNALFSPSLTADASLICFAGLNRPQVPGPGYRVYLYDRPATKLVDLPGLSMPNSEERMPKISSDGRWIVFVSNRPPTALTEAGEAGLSDIFLYDRKEAHLVELAGLNSANTDVEPSLSADGNLIAFASDRPGGKGSRDVYLYDRTSGKLIELPSLNSAGPEYTPTLSRTGRFIAFVSERLGGEGERDIYLYDRETQRLLPTPGLNSKNEDFDPSFQ